LRISTVLSVSPVVKKSASLIGPPPQSHHSPHGEEANAALTANGASITLEVDLHHSQSVYSESIK
jgi:hypothetical protein